MPSSRLILCTLALPWLAACASAPTAAPEGASPVTVAFIAPDKFTDLGSSRPPMQTSRDAYLAELRKFIVQDTARRLPPGQRLDIEVTDVDMAGDFEPWRMRSEDVRVVRDIYPPRIDLRFRRTDGDGAVLQQGERKLRDPAYLMTAANRYADNDPLRHEKALLETWMQKEFGGK
ncbi:MAG: DUF3016 domain-containing protein [Ottowia sp.]|uniref:DUF3016 domain-containing protein n=1 Tax=Ottowia sp. TaxID=1898956 RepID=UPI0039E6BFA0